MSDTKSTHGGLRAALLTRDWRIPWWARYGLVGSLVLAAVGLAAPLAFSGSGASSGQETGGQSWIVEQSPWMWRAGVSFIAAYAVSYVIRWTIKIGLIVAAVVAIVLAGLQHFGIVDVKWNDITTRAEAAAEEVQTRTREETLALLPSAGAGSLGFGSGLFRRRA